MKGKVTLSTRVPPELATAFSDPKFRATVRCVEESSEWVRKLTCRIFEFMGETACATAWCPACYREWKELEDLREAADRAARSRQLVEQGDPETEAAIAALEQGWLAEKTGRS